jgi:hypothetical protein
MGDRRRDDDEDDRRDRRSRDRDDDDRGSRRSRDDDDRPSRRSRDEDEGRGSRRSRDDDGEERGSSRSSYRYERRDSDSVRQRSQMGNNDFDKILKSGIKMFKPADGDNCIRIVPPTWKKAEHYGLDIYVHYGVGADRGTYLCLHKHKGEPDPIHEAYLEAKNEYSEDEKNEDLKKLVKELEAKRRVLVYLIDRDRPKEGIMAWAMPWTLDRDIVQVMQDKRTGEVLPIDDPEEGYDVQFTKKGSKNLTEYTGVAIARRSSPLDNDKALEFAQENPLPDQLQFFDYDHIAKAFGGKGKQSNSRRRDDDDDADDRPSRSRAHDDDDRGSSRSRDDDPPRRSRDDDDRPSRRGKDDEPTWASIHDMTKSELEDLIEEKDLDIKPKDAKNVEDLADWVCEELKIKEPKKESRERSRDDDEGSDRLAEMRKRRERD